MYLLYSHPLKKLINKNLIKSLILETKNFFKYKFVQNMLNINLIYK